MTGKWEWPFWSIVGLFFGLVFGWLWAVGSIAAHPRYWHGTGPRWMRAVAGEPKRYRVVPRRYAHIPPKVFSLVALVAALGLYHYLAWLHLATGGRAVVAVEASFPTFLLVGWGGVVYVVERSLRCLRP